MSSTSWSINERYLYNELISNDCFRYSEHKDILLSSGEKSNFYVDLKYLLSDSFFLKKIVEQLNLSFSMQGISVIGGMEYGAIPFMFGFANIREEKSLVSTRVLVIRKHQKTHGTKNRVEGYAPHLIGKQAVVFEDVTTTGGSVMESVNVLRELGLVVDTAITIIDRNEGAPQFLNSNGITLRSLLSINELLSAWRLNTNVTTN
jgi:orotate phosphoribosyltransferase